MWLIVFACLGVLFLLLLVAVAISWIVLSDAPYTDVVLEPGKPYQVAGRQYTFPIVNEIVGVPRLLKSEVIESLRDILHRAHELFTELKIDYHITGGTLMGAVKHRAIPMPWDDDADMCVDWEHRETLWSPDFRHAAERHGLAVRYLKHNTLARADVHGSGVRLQLLNGQRYETCDVFFWKKMDNKICKIDSWSDTAYVPNPREQFEIDDVYPRNVEFIDGLYVMMPKNPVALLKQQYGEKVMQVIKVRHAMFSHRFPMQFLQALWVPYPIP